ncbi:MAG TPA: biotin/lipoyl-containing protein [Chloroflexota bacterium]|jgi:acetyl-CoA carboxylase biotin carboxyl carrier protein|nr:biotin/lipoyl-containing protein [Chloroflexota bacterium]
MSDEPVGESGLERYIRDELSEVLLVLSRSRVRELELEDGDRALIIRRSDADSGGGFPAPISDAEGDMAETEGLHPNVAVISAPMVGTFFHSERPGGAALVSEGARVERGSLIGVIEALQVLTEVEADMTGTVQHMLTTDGEPVEYGQALVEVLLDR